MRKYFNKKLLILLVGVFSFTTLFAQNKKISGLVTDEEGSPLIGATITVKNTSISVATDGEGKFSLIVPSTNTALLVSFVGMETQQISIGTKSIFNIRLRSSNNSLSDVVVVGYGKMKKSDMSSAVETISSKDLNKTVNVTLDDALQGKAANVYVSNPSGAPGSGSTVIIRGISTITGNYQPLYVIDGVQIRPDVPTGGQYNVATGEANALSGINPDDIADISILK